MIDRLEKFIKNKLLVKDCDLSYKVGLSDHCDRGKDTKTSYHIVFD